MIATGTNVEAFSSTELLIDGKVYSYHNKPYAHNTCDIRQLLLLDVSGDCRPDQVTICNDGTIRVNDESRESLTDSDANTRVTIGDFDGSATNDLLYSTRNGEMVFALNEQDGELKPVALCTSRPFTIAKTVKWSVSELFGDKAIVLQSANSIVVQDVNSDGFVDLIVLVSINGVQ